MLKLKFRKVSKVKLLYLQFLYLYLILDFIFVFILLFFMYHLTAFKGKWLEFGIVNYIIVLNDE